ncbi:hypothetical protein QO010_004161 [Caulobacter ginsengisoli]|uniref:CUE domain-containing protein n=1 Tax=Caulobacter ginsengisoli TaxID=400775 RepID=A0ABU0IWG8_9CAUL|nr:hypothetical protein [Caulobacter ginsengisoli]MDQ0466368.1 hypothetical protein [Caulobacter ginsengisoli]
MALAARRQLTSRADRSLRSLGALQKSGSTSRVLNLLAIANRAGNGDEDFVTKPFFLNPVLNACVIVKHRLRADEAYLFDGWQGVATKVIIPFERSDLRMGGRSVFVGQRGWRASLSEACSEGPDFERDVHVLELVDGLPSLDPFLLREHLRRNGYDVGRCYFALSEGDLARMRAFVSQQISRLVAIAFQAAGADGINTGRLVGALLSTEIDERLEPLRLTLMLEGDTFRDGVFSWKGFLYYKWSLSGLWGDLDQVIPAIQRLRAIGPSDMETKAYISGAKGRLADAIVACRVDVAKTLKVYDDAFRDLTQNGKPAAFRDFLLKAPDMFVSLGERLGAIAHIASFWRYRFPDGQAPAAGVDEVVDLLQEFEASLNIKVA